MRLARINYNGTTRVAALEGNQWRLTASPEHTLENIIQNRKLHFSEELVDIDWSQLVAPINPSTIFGIGLNYHDTVSEMGWEVPDTPFLFPKLTSSITGPFDKIVVDPTITQRADWEAELAVVIGTKCRNVTAELAHEVIFGYTIANDISARDIQESDGQWVRGKGLDTFCPIGPVIVTPDELPDASDLKIQTWHNGELVQDGSTSDMIFSIPELIEYLSTWFTLYPGDIILTGTPAGCGDFRNPKRALMPGDQVKVEVSEIGFLNNSVVAPTI